jgi:ornithine carbamoyltransferase
MSHDILELEGRKVEGAEKVEEEEDVDCVDTKVWLWDGDEYEEFESDYLNQIFPYKINKKTMTKGSQFIFHFLSSSLHYYIELQQEGEVEPEKMGSKDIKVIEEILQTDETDNWIAFRRWGERFNKRNEFLKHEE